jgi:hypothetical protein
MKELVKEMNKYKVDTCALQEIRWPRKGTVAKKIETKILFENARSNYF